jgi:sulfite reductase beta subunit-like hemoprotein
MHTALKTGRPRARPVGHRGRIAAGVVATLAAAAAVVGLAVAGGDEGVAPTTAAPAQVIDARPLVDPRVTAERFHHRLDAEPDRIDGRRAAELFHHRP